MLLQTARHTGNAIEKEKPFLDGDFTRDSSNPLDVYEDMNIKAPEAPAPTTPATPAPQINKTAVQPAASVKASDKGTGKGAGKNAGEGVADDASKNASAVQLASEASYRDLMTSGLTKQLQDPATTATPPATEAKVKPSANGTNESVAAAVNNTPGKNESQSQTPEAAPTISPATANTSSCVTRNDPRAVAWWVESAPEGSPCVFGVDVEDEGSHCIFSDGKFGSSGWCWTEKDKSAWGSCSDSCPMYGPPAVLDSKIDGVVEVLDKVAAKVDKLAGNTSSKAEESVVEDEKQTVEKVSKEDDAKKAITKDAKGK